MSNFAAFTGAFFGKKFIEITDGKTISVFNMVLQNKQYLLIFTAIMMALASYLIKKLQRLSDSG
ncbi:MAG: hypothetical protein GX045_09215 [Clostridiaceae bacterium]|nr:hypothetical protein [Clostridiaceae bacterium]